MIIEAGLVDIEVKTINGDWETTTFDNGEFIAFNFDDDQFAIYRMVTDSTCSERVDGILQFKGDTLTFYTQGKEPEILILKHLSMNTMIIGNDNDNFVMSREYYTDNKFPEVLELKGGFWWGVFLFLFWWLKYSVSFGFCAPFIME